MIWKNANLTCFTCYLNACWIQTKISSHTSLLVKFIKLIIGWLISLSYKVNFSFKRFSSNDFCFDFLLNNPVVRLILRFSIWELRWINYHTDFFHKKNLKNFLFLNLLYEKIRRQYAQENNKNALIRFVYCCFDNICDKFLEANWFWIILSSSRAKFLEFFVFV